MAPWGGRVKSIGTNPWSIAAPGRPARGGRAWTWPTPPWLAARSTSPPSAGSRSREGWAADADGAPTTDPAAAIAGLILPMAGPKGYVISFMMDVLAGVLTGSAFGDEVAGPYEPDRRSGAGHLLLTIDVAAFAEPRRVRQRGSRPWSTRRAGAAGRLGRRDPRPRRARGPDPRAAGRRRHTALARPGSLPRRREPPASPSRARAHRRPTTSRHHCHRCPHRTTTGGHARDRPHRLPARPPRPARGVPRRHRRERRAHRSPTSPAACTSTSRRTSPTTTTSSSTSCTPTRTRSPPTGPPRTSRPGARPPTAASCPAARSTPSATVAPPPPRRAVVKILVLPGDGIGPEITAATLRVLEALDQRLGLGLELERHDIGLASLAATGSTLPDAVLARVAEVDGTLLGPVSHYDYPPRDRGRDQPVGGAADPLRAVREHPPLPLGRRAERAARRRWTSSSCARTPRASTPTATCTPAAASSCPTPTPPSRCARSPRTRRGAVARAAFELARTRRATRHRGAQGQRPQAVRRPVPRRGAGGRRPATRTSSCASSSSTPPRRG